jgi:hypothetical protein
MFGTDFGEKCIIMQFSAAEKDKKSSERRVHREKIGRRLEKRKHPRIPPAHLKVASRRKTPGRKVRAYEIFFAKSFISTHITPRSL